MKIAGVQIEDQEELQGLVHTVYSPDIPIENVATGKTYVPADDLVGAIAEQLGLDRAALTESQRESIEAFIRWAQS